MVILTHDKKHLNILTGFVCDKTLPKYKALLPQKGTENKTDLINNLTPIKTQTKSDEVLSYDKLKKIVLDKNCDVDEFNFKITLPINKVNVSDIELTYAKNSSSDFGDIEVEPWDVATSNSNGDFVSKKGWFSKFCGLFKRKKEKNHSKFDVIKFFSDVHDAVKLDESEASKYVDRISEYIEYIGYVEKTGQVALRDKLLQNLVINKLESILYVKGFYKAVNEDALVKLAQNIPDSISLDYIKNYVRNIPVSVLKNKIKADQLHVFDNYCILHYDFDNDGKRMTNEERTKEYIRRKDPILFGMIKGSNKLYFIDDWVDEYVNDDLTFDKIVSIVGKDLIEKGYIKEKIELD